MAITKKQEDDMRIFLATIRKKPSEDNQAEEEWTDAHQYGENPSDAYQSGVSDGEELGSIEVANSIRAIIGE